MIPSADRLPRAEAKTRIDGLRAALKAANPAIDAALIVQDVDLYYFAGTIQTSHLLVSADDEPVLLVRKVLERALDDSPLENVRPMTSLRVLGEELRSNLGAPPWRIGMELDVLPAATAAIYQEVLGDTVEIVDVSPLVLGLRAVKSAWEIERIRESAAINDSLYDCIAELASEGVSTYELQARLDCRARELGHVGFVSLRGFNVHGLIGVVVSGPSGAVPGHSQFPIGGTGPHRVVAHGGDFLPIERDVPVIFDYLSNRNGYHHDQTRMAVRGAMPADAECIYRSMQATLRVIESRAKSGIAPSALYEDALEFVASQGLADGFLGTPGLAVPFVGHAIGLEVNESPVLARRFDVPLVAGNVIAIEPKFTHADYGVIGVENTYVVSDEGLVNLGESPETVVSL